LANSDNFFVGTLDEKLASFDELLVQIDGVDSKVKQLWKQIYFNALDDRSNAATLFVDLRDMLLNSPDDAKGTQHVLHGATLAKYLERLQRSNEQLLKLAELVEDAVKQSEQLDTDDIFCKMETAVSSKKK